MYINIFNWLRVVFSCCCGCERKSMQKDRFGLSFSLTAQLHRFIDFQPTTQTVGGWKYYCQAQNIMIKMMEIEWRKRKRAANIAEMNEKNGHSVRNFSNYFPFLDLQVLNFFCWPAAQKPLKCWNNCFKSIQTSAALCSLLLLRCGCDYGYGCGCWCCTTAQWTLGVEKHPISHNGTEFKHYLRIFLKNFVKFLFVFEFNVSVYDR